MQLQNHKITKAIKCTCYTIILPVTEFTEQWKTIREGFLSMKHSIDTERTTMEKLGNREKNN